MILLALVLAVSKTTEASSSDELMKSVTELIKVQMQAMTKTKAASVQSLPSLDTYTGKGNQAEHDGIDRWLQRFDERAHPAEWSDEIKLYQLKVHLNKTALHVFRIFSTEEKSSSCKNAADSLRKRFHPVDIKELRGLEFHRNVQDESVEQLGLKLRLGRRAFPSTEGKDCDHLLKGRFFQALLIGSFF